jgi:hypothetical protein
MLWLLYNGEGASSNILKRAYVGPTASMNVVKRIFLPGIKLQSSSPESVTSLKAVLALIFSKPI